MKQAGIMQTQILLPSQKVPIVVLGTMFCVSVVSGNMSFKYIHVSFAQAIGSTTPAFSALFAAMMLGIYEHKYTLLALIPVVLGAAIATWNEPVFHFIGFIHALNATWTRAMRGIIQQKLMSNDEVKLDGLNTLAFMSPVAALQLGIASFFMEPEALGEMMRLCGESSYFTFLLLLNLLLAYFVNLGGMLVTKYLGALTLQVLGNLRGVVATAVSVAIFQNPVSVTALFGYTVCVAGVWVYSEVKKKYKPAKQAAPAPEPKPKLETA